MTADPVVAVRGVCFAYDGPSVLEDIDLTVPSGDFVSVVGPNGGGKTTLLKLIAGLLSPIRGQVRVFGRPPAAVCDRIGYVPQNPRIDPHFPANAMDVVLTGCLSRRRWAGPYRRADSAAAEEALHEVAMHELRARPYTALSGGQKQRVLIARALAAQPDLLLLDEPTASLDRVVEYEFYDLLQRLNSRLTIIMVSHDLGFVSRFVKTVVCVKQRVAVHPTSEIRGELVEEIYGMDLRMVRHDHRCAEEGHRCTSS